MFDKIANLNLYLIFHQIQVKSKTLRGSHILPCKIHNVAAKQRYGIDFDKTEHANLHIFFLFCA